MKILSIVITTLFLIFGSVGSKAIEYPNILLIIADDLGVDALNGYDIGTVLPNRIDFYVLILIFTHMKKQHISSILLS